MSDLSVIWEDDALKLLEGRDRYTLNAIREEFRRDPQKDAIEFDPAHNTFLTPVSDSRFSVVWRLNEEGQQAVVRAVVPPLRARREDLPLLAHHFAEDLGRGGFALPAELLAKLAAR